MFVAGPARWRYDRNGTHWTELASDDPPCPLDAVGAVGRIGRAHGEKPELLEQFLHVGRVFFRLVEYEKSVSVERFEVGFDSCGLIPLDRRIGLYGEHHA